MKVQQLLVKGYEILKSEDINSYIIDCQLILAKVLKLDRLSIILNKDREVYDSELLEFFRLINLRKKKMPLKYITEEAEFMGISLYIKPGVLIPRPDTEILVEEVLKYIEKHKLHCICDVCCGSGAIGISIAKLSENTRVYCADISEISEEVTKKNIELLKLQNTVTFFRSDLLKFALEKSLNFDMIVSNPPYIKTEVIPTLMKDVREYEPYIALWGGEDGLDFYRKLAKQSSSLLREGGVLAFEIGHDEAQEVTDIMRKNNFSDIKVVRDLAGFDRVVIGIKYEEP